MDDEKLREEFPGNSYADIKPPTKPPAQQNKSKPKTKQKADIPREKTIGEKMVDSVKSIDGKSIFEKIITEWLFPGLEAAGNDILATIFGGKSTRPGVQSGKGGSRDGMNRVPYNSMYNGGRNYNAIDPSTRPRIIFKTRAERDQCFSGVAEYIDDYGKITLKEFYNMVSEVTNGEIRVSKPGYPLTRYGWYSVEGAITENTREGYLLEMPKAEVFER